MRTSPVWRVAAAVAVAVAALGAASSAGAASPNAYVVTPLVSNNGVPGTLTDTDLQNAWGLGANATSPWWVADNGTGKSTLYNGAGAPSRCGQRRRRPTGTVVNSDAPASPCRRRPARFLFDSEAGRSSAGTAAQPHSGGSTCRRGRGLQGTGDRRHGGRPAALRDRLPQPRGRRVRRQLATRARGRSVRRSVAPARLRAVRDPGDRRRASSSPTPSRQAGSDDEVARPGPRLRRRVRPARAPASRASRSRGQLNAPWGIAQAPRDFGRFSGDLLVGNFGDGTIHAYRPQRRLHRRAGGAAAATTGDGRLVIDGLWALEFGNGADHGPTNTLFFTAGPNDENDGLFGKITAAP